MRAIVTALLLLVPAPLPAWGPAGHHVVARVAEAQLSPAARAAARALIGNQHLSEVSMDADVWKKRPGDIRTADWHFVNIPKEPPSARYDAARDCRDSDCVVARIEVFKGVLADRHASQKARSDALAYLIHFVGDVHQPFHCIDGPMPGGGTDHGANLIRVTIDGQHVNGQDDSNDNLHYIWDITLVDRAMGSSMEVQFVNTLLSETLAARSPQQLASGTSADWANASRLLAIPAYVADRTNLQDGYFAANVPVVKEQLLLAGLRLARIIEEALR